MQGVVEIKIYATICVILNLESRSVYIRTGALQPLNIEISTVECKCEPFNLKMCCWIELQPVKYIYELLDITI